MNNLNNEQKAIISAAMYYAEKLKNNGVNSENIDEKWGEIRLLASKDSSNILKTIESMRSHF